MRIVCASFSEMIASFVETMGDSGAFDRARQRAAIPALPRQKPAASSSGAR